MADALGLGPSLARGVGSSPTLPTMEFAHFSKNGELLPMAQASVPLSSIEYQYGFGVYETVRVAKGTPRFLSDHAARLMNSARIISLEHRFDERFVQAAIGALIEKERIDTCNVKLLLIGGKDADSATLYIVPLNPFFPEKTFYRDGVRLITVQYERAFPHAKTLNMLGSYLAYRKARAEGCYDALLANRSGCILEGTRTNFFAVRGRAVFSPPESEILLGVTRKHVLEAAQKLGLRIEERGMRPIDLPEYEGAFLTSTSSNVLPIRSIDGHVFGPTPPALVELMGAYDAFLERELT